jgi:hypothetical protein
VTYAGTALLIAGWVGAEFSLRRHGLEWVITGGQRVRLRRLGTKVHLGVLGCIALLWVPLLFRHAERRTPIPEAKSNLWLRISDTSGITFQVGKNSIIPSGSVRGVVSDIRAHVYLLYRVSRECYPEPFGGISTGEFVQDRCRDSEAGSTELSWRTSEASVDAVGNWDAQICQYPRTFPFIVPDFDYTEFVAVATNSASAIAERITQLTCSVSEKQLADISSSLTCSAPVISLRAKPPGYATWNQYAPKPRQRCF